MEEAHSKTRTDPVLRSTLGTRNGVLMDLIGTKAHPVNNSVTDAYDTVGRLYHKEKENNRVHSKYEAQDFSSAIRPHCHDLMRKRKYHSDGEGEEEGVDRSRLGNAPTWKRRKARTASSLSHTELLARLEETRNSNDNVTAHVPVNEPPTSWKPSGGRSSIARLDPPCFQIVSSPSANRSCAENPACTPPRSDISRNIISRGQLVDWTFVSDVEESALGENKIAAGSQRIATPGPLRKTEQAGLVRDGERSSPDDAQDSAVDSDDTGYEGASEWEGLSEASLQNFCCEHGNVLLDAIGVYRTSSRRCISGPFVHDNTEPVTPEGTRTSASVYGRRQQTPSLFTPSPLNSDDYRRLGDLPDDFVPSPLSSKDVRNDGRHQSRSYANPALCNFYDASKRFTSPSVEARGYADGQDDPDLLPSNELLSNAKDSLETFEDPTSDHQTNIGSLLFRLDERSSPPTSIALAEGVQCMHCPSAAFPVVGTLLPVFDWGTPVSLSTELDGAASKENLASAFEDTGSEFSDEFLYDDKVWVEKWARDVQAASGCEEAL